MMKKQLIILLLALFVIGLVFTAIPFIGSLSPTVRSVNQSLHIPIGGLEQGQYLIKDLKRSRLFILNAYESGIKVYLVPIHEEMILMPDLRWFRWGGLCNTFEPEQHQGKLKRNGIFRCMDKDLYEWHKQEWRWDFEGHNLGKYTEDMAIPRHLIKHGQLILLEEKSEF